MKWSLVLKVTCRCGPCLAKVKKCAKCGDSQSEWVNVEAPTQQEVTLMVCPVELLLSSPPALLIHSCLPAPLAQVERKDKEFQADLKALPERRRRTFLRYLARLKTGTLLETTLVHWS